MEEAYQTYEERKKELLNQLPESMYIAYKIGILYIKINDHQSALEQSRKIIENRNYLEHQETVLNFLTDLEKEIELKQEQLNQLVKEYNGEEID